MSEVLLTQEVGSLAKPDWRVAVAAGQPITSEHSADARYWAERLGLGHNDRVRIGGLLHSRADKRDAVKGLAAYLAVRLQEAAGLDIIYDGEQDRSEMYQYAVERTEGFDWRGRVQAFDNRSYKKAACVDEPSIGRPWHTDELQRLKSYTDKPIKVPITGAYTLADWSFDEHYGDRREFVLGLARNVIRPNVEALLKGGAEWIQIDEPAATTVPSEVPLFVESFNESIAGLVGRFSVHICFSDYSLLLPHVERLENCSQLSLEFANRDGSELGTDAAVRPAYEILDELARACPEVGFGLGVTSVHDDRIEPPELVRDRVLRAVDIVGDPTKIYPSPDCGLRTRSWDVAYDKLRATVEGTQLAKQQL